MSTERDAARAATPAPAPPQPAVEAPAPAAPVPLPATPETGTLVVGHAEDRAEADADRQADAALARLRRLEPAADGAEAHQHGPGCDHLRRTPAPVSGSPVVGYEGGGLDAGTSAAIEGRRGAGSPLEAGVRRRMETAFGSSFSGVRVHADDTAARLNSAVSARAFTTGKDVFFGKGQYAPDTAAGERVLAHELAHTLQPGGATHRLLATAAPAVTPRAHAAIMRSVATTAQVRRWPWSKKKDEPKKVEQPVAAPAPYAGGPAGKIGSAGEEGGKLGAVTSTVGGSFGAAQAVGKAAPELGGLVGVSSGVLVAGDAAMGLNNARKMGNDAEKYDDDGMRNLSSRKYKNQGGAMANGLVGITKGGVEMGYLAGAGATSTKTALASTTASAALGAAAGGMGIAAGSVQTLQGLWKGGKAVQKLCRLKWGRAKKMVSVRGREDWKPTIMSSTKFKAASAALKTTLGVLGIAAGALLVVSNPVGWGIGIAAAIAGGVWAIGKITAKIVDARKRAQIAKDIESGKAPEEAAGEGAAKSGKQAISERADQQKSRSAKKKGADLGEDEKARIDAIEKANEVARQASSYARVAGEMRDRVLQNDDEVNASLGTALQQEEATQAPVVTSHDVALAELLDAYMLLSAINVDVDEARSASGQELIEKKLSMVEAM